MIYAEGCPVDIFEQALATSPLSLAQKKAVKAWRREPEQVRAIASVNAMMQGNYPLAQPEPVATVR